MKREEIVKRYIEDGECPFCGSSVKFKEVGKPEYHSNIPIHEAYSLWQKTKCRACGSTWFDVYSLTDIIRIEDAFGAGRVS